MRQVGRSETLNLLTRLHGDPATRLVKAADGAFEIAGGAASKARFSAATVRALLASGLLREAEPGAFDCSPTVAAWLKRHHGGELRFRRQHQRLEKAQVDPANSATVLRNMDESPLATLVRRPGRAGKPWLASHAVAAAERLRRDFEMGGLQPRITANWSASINHGRRSGDSGGMTELTDMALAARIRFNKAVREVGPELSGALVDVCCFLKGLEAVERERQWPARSAKLVLRLGLDALARHYGLTASAEGHARSGAIRHWGVKGYRPDIS